MPKAKRRGRKPSAQPLVTVSVRMTKDLLAYVDAIVRRRRGEQGASQNRSLVMREIVAFHRDQQ